MSKIKVVRPMHQETQKLGTNSTKKPNNISRDVGKLIIVITNF